MFASFKTFIQVLLTALVVMAGSPQPTCAAPASADSPACCAQGGVCHCPPAKPCAPSCALAHSSNFDQQLPSRAVGASTRSGSLFVLAAPVTIKYPAFVPVSYPRECISPPFGGSPPQAVLRLWLI